MSDAVQLVLCTVPNEETASRLAETLVAERLAACVNILPGLTSIYRWQGEVARESELLLLIKTRETLYSSLEQRLQALHPYELPEIIAVPIHAGLAGYLNWIQENAGSDL